MTNLRTQKQTDCRPHCPSSRAPASWPTWLIRPISLVVVLSASLLGCGRTLDEATVNKALQQVGLLDVTAQPKQYQLLCDAQARAACTPDTLEQTLDAVLTAAGREAEAGSRIELWMLGGSSVGETHSLGVQVSPKLTATREPARKDAVATWHEQARSFFLAAAEPYFKLPHTNRTVLAESLTKIALARDPELPAEIVVLSDARERSSAGGDLVCGALPSPAAWTKRLQHRQILGAGILRNTWVAWAFVNMGAKAPRCATRMAQELGVRALWLHALSAAGVEGVSFQSGPVNLTDGPATEALATRGQP